MYEILIFWNMPPFAAKFITRESEGKACHHCALHVNNWVYDAVPPFVRKVGYIDYLCKIAKWKRNWRYWLKPMLYMESFPINVTRGMIQRAESQIGMVYDLSVYYRDHPNRTHCSKYLNHITQCDYGRLPHRVRPIDIRNYHAKM